MSDDAVRELFDEFVDSYLDGGNPDIGRLLQRAGPDGDRLAALVDRFLELAPAQPAAEEEVIRLNARLAQVTPLTEARLRCKLKIDAVVDQLLGALQLNKRLLPRLRGAYQELEGEQLDPAGVDERVWSALRQILGVDASRLSRPWQPPAQETVFARAADAPVGAAPLVDRRRELEPQDEIDRLFGRA